MIKLYKIRLDELKSADYTEVYNLLDSAQKLRIDAKQSDDDKKRSLAGYYLVFKGARELFGQSDFKIYYTKNGKPFCDFCHFSVSHSGSMAVCAFADREIGVDVQEITDIKPRESYRFFTPRESDYVNENAQLLPVRFTEIFTKKEAAVKLLGATLSQMGEIDTFDEKFTFYSKREKNLIITVCEQQS